MTTEKTLEERQKEFIDGYEKLKNDTNIDFALLPQFVPNEKGTWEIVVGSQLIDLTKMPVKSPFIESK